MILNDIAGRSPSRGPLFRTLLLVIFLIVTWNACSADERAPAAVAGEPTQSELRPLVVNLLRWIGEHSDYKVDAFVKNPPKISFCACGDSVLYEGHRIVIHEAVKGVYDKRLRKITLVKPWTKKNLVNVSTLLHELVHFVQYQSRHWPCWNATEWQAYKLQALWLKQHGVKPKFNWVQIYLWSSCRKRPSR